ncbi:MAG: hypothetical protein LBJ36_02955 [Synergistaceae bacterium]|jgi:hypothetical protein|nr:hypothetical protein [Synergistaceae bacterium]
MVFARNLNGFCEEMDIDRAIAPDVTAYKNIENLNVGENDSESVEYNALLNRWSQGQKGASALSDVLNKIKTK